MRYLSLLLVLMGGAFPLWAASPFTESPRQLHRHLTRAYVGLVDPEGQRMLVCRDSANTPPYIELRKCPDGLPLSKAKCELATCPVWRYFEERSFYGALATLDTGNYSKNDLTDSLLAVEEALELPVSEAQAEQLRRWANNLRLIQKLQAQIADPALAGRYLLDSVEGRALLEPFLTREKLEALKKQEAEAKKLKEEAAQKAAEEAEARRKAEERRAEQAIFQRVQCHGECEQARGICFIIHERPHATCTRESEICKEKCDRR